MRIFLLGFMGTGKSFAGRKMGNKLNIPFIDLDQWIEDAAGMGIPEIFEKKGENAFRQMEQNALHEMIEFENVIVALGGGAPCFFDNMDWINANGISIYLEASPSFLVQRLKKKPERRPLLANLSENELLAFIQKKILERQAYYERAHFSLSKDENGSILEALEAMLKNNS